MLKIKDDVDLKELEKFGFYKTGGVYQLNLEIRNKNNSPFRYIKSCIYITSSDRIIRIATLEEAEIIKLDILYNLIKSDLIELTK